MKNSSFFLIFVLFLLTTNYYLLTTNNERGDVKSADISYTTGVSAFIGRPAKFNVFGYTSPKALVTIEGIGINHQTYSNDTGYFSFKNVFSPVSSPELCLTAQDQLGRLSSPNCLPPFPIKLTADIGPVILPPTVSLDKNDYFVGDEVILSGQTLPHSTVDLSIFTKETPLSFPNLSSIGNFVKSAYAFTFPKLTTQADENGNYAISLPSYKNQDYRLFTQTSYDNNPSSKSVILNMAVLPIWMIIIKYLFLLFGLLKPRLFEIIIILELIVFVVYIFRRYFQPHIIARNRSLILRENFALLEEEKIN